MKRWILVAAIFIPPFALAQSEVKDPVEFSEKDTGYQCQLEIQNEAQVVVSCASEVYLGDGFWCDQEGYCEPVFDVPKQNWCFLSFDKIAEGDYKYSEKTCEARQVED